MRHGFNYSTSMETLPDILTPVEAAPAWRPQLWSVSKRLQETYDTFTIELKPVETAGRCNFRPGQFNMLYAFGVGEAPISISGDPAQPSTLLHSIRMVGNVTLALKKLHVGDPIGVRGPFGAHWPVELAEGNDVLIVAGGIGFAPLRPVVHHVLAHRHKYGKVVLLYGTRSPEDILFREDVAAWRGRFDVDVFVTVDTASEEWRGNVGVVTSLIPKTGVDPENTVAMVCGPELMMRFTVAELRKRGIDPDRIFISMERNMKCGIAQCGHCQLGPTFVCKDGPVFPYNKISGLMTSREL